MQNRILFVYTHFSTFVRTDYEILSEVHKVTRYQYKSGKGIIKNAVAFIRQFIFLLFNIWRFDAVFIWFADYHSFLPVLFAKLTGKKSFVVIGGYDVARIPELNYGVFISKLRGFFAAISMRKSAVNLAVSRYVERKVKRIAPKSETKLVYNCVNINSTHNTSFQKEHIVITVGLIDNERTFYLKGIDTYIEVARLLPEIKFIIIGMSKNLPFHIYKSMPDNIECTERVPHEELEKYYSKAKVYCQFSRSESFGVAIVEAMYFGCIPVVTNVGGMPEVVGDFGFVVNRNPEIISKSIHFLFNITKPKEVNISDWIKSRFNIIIRKEKLLEILG